MGSVPKVCVMRSVVPQSCAMMPFEMSCEVHTYDGTTVKPMPFSGRRVTHTANTRQKSNSVGVMAWPVSGAEDPDRAGPCAAQGAPHQIDGAVLAHTHVPARLEHCVCIPVYANRAQVVVTDSLLLMSVCCWPRSPVPIRMHTILLLQQSASPCLCIQPLPAGAPRV